MLAQAAEDLQFHGAPLALSDEEKFIYASIPPSAQQRMREYIQRTAEGKRVESNFRPVLESMLRGSLAFWRKSLRTELDQLLIPLTDDEELNALLSSMEEQPEVRRRPADRYAQHCGRCCRRGDAGWRGSW